jgi:hypothetical protein
MSTELSNKPLKRKALPVHDGSPTPVVKKLRLESEEVVRPYEEKPPFEIAIENPAVIPVNKPNMDRPLFVGFSKAKPIPGIPEHASAVYYHTLGMNRNLHNQVSDFLEKIDMHEKIERRGLRRDYKLPNTWITKDIESILDVYVPNWREEY